MSARKSSRSKAPVKYTSDTEGSDFETKPKRGSASKKKKEAAAPKKATKREAEAEPASTTTTPKRRKKDPETLAAELHEKAQQQEEKAEKASHKKIWEDWQQDNDAEGELLDAEPAREESITQTDCQKKYGLKPTELGSLKHFEKKHSTYGNTTKLFLEDEVKTLAYRKLGILDGATGEEDVLKKGEELWKEEHKNDALTEATPKKSTEAKPAKPKAKTAKQKWTEYINSHSLTENDKLAEEPEEVINQTESKTKYSLTPQDLACLPHFPKKNAAYGNTMKLFKESEVKVLAYRKAAVLAGVEEDDEEELLKKGKEAFEEKK